MAKVERYIGLMSGTSLDGVDGVVLHAGADPGDCRVSAHVHVDLPSELRAEMLALNLPGDNELHRAALAANALAVCQADVIKRLLALERCDRSDIAAVGSHGQTVRHRPGEFDPWGYTLQLNQGALLAELCGIDTVCDFRSRDVAAGGQGAPLVPAFHLAMWGGSGTARAVLNLGGIANLSILPAEESSQHHTLGFDSGPGNCLLDLWAQLHLGTPYDPNGDWAASGQVHQGLLAALLGEPYFALPPPKSTGRDLFNGSWLHKHLGAWAGLGCEDVQATLAELTAVSTADALRRHVPETTALICCGGGVYNSHLMQRVRLALPGVRVGTTAEYGLHPMHVEAAAFAWLARAYCKQQAGNLPYATGAAGPRLLGALYPGRGA